MAIMKRNVVFLSIILGILCIGTIFLYIQLTKPEPVDPLLAEQAAGFQVATVQVTADGFVPDHIELQPGVPAKINFKKATGFTCIKDFILKDLKMDTPLEKGDNVVSLPSMQPGTYEYHCGMYMYYGSITVKEDHPA